MIQIGSLTTDIIVQNFARSGRFCETARLIFIGPPKTAQTIKCRANPPGAFPDWLIRQCEQARRDHLAGKDIGGAWPLIEEAS